MLLDLPCFLLPTLLYSQHKGQRDKTLFVRQASTMTVSDRNRRQRKISAKREAIVSDYAKRWSGMIREWRAPRRNDAVWLTYSANYLFNTRGLKWTVDPALLSNRVPEAQMLDTSQDLNDLDFVLLTHAHIDHIDVVLWTQLKESNCHWIVPEHMVEFFTDEASMRDSRYSVAVPGKEIAVAGARITPFGAPHYERCATGEINQVDSIGYFAETAGGSYLLPGDIRTYDPVCIEPFADVSAVFAHVFLGRSAALERDPPLLNAFVDFYLSCRPKKIVLSHLHELGREPEDCWLTSHARTLAKAFTAVDSKIKVAIPEWYEETIL